MTIEDYLNPDFTVVKKIIFLAITALTVFFLRLLALWFKQIEEWQENK